MYQNLRRHAEQPQPFHTVSTSRVSLTLQCVNHLFQFNPLTIGMNSLNCLVGS